MGTGIQRKKGSAADEGTLQEREQMRTGGQMRKMRQLRTQVQGVRLSSESVCRVYVSPGSRPADRQEKSDPAREREKLKELLLPFVKETVKKQLREEREYYRSRPSLAAKQLEHVLGAGNLESAVVPAVTLRVYEQLEERMRCEWIRKGR